MNNLLKVILVDDEQNIINLLKLCIQWEQLNMEVVGEANCGIEALDLIDDLKPDIVLTDIQMPYMDGIELSKQILERHIDINIIILTAHEQFEYAQQSVSIGISDFILKPIDPDLITNILWNLQEKIYKNRKRLLYLETSFKYIQNNIDELRNKFLNDLINANLNNIHITEGMDIHNIILNPTDTPIQVSVINIFFDPLKYTTIKKQIIIQNCISYITETFVFNKNLYVFKDTHNNIVLLNNDPSVYLPEISEHITLYFQSNIHTNVYCGIGNIVWQITDISTSYDQAKHSLKLCYALNENIVLYSTQENLSSKGNNNPLEDLDVLVKLGLKKQATEITSKLLYSTLQEEIHDLSSTKLLVIDISSKIVYILTQNGIPLTSLNFINLSYSSLVNLQLYSDIEKYIMNIVSKACDLMKKTNKHKSNDVVAQIIKYLESNYDDDTISLSSLAKQFYINSSYLSRVFKNETQKSFSEYLVEL
ncbi:MAG TPA: response regulator, partial [Clostridiales bacterium]|nr:response regulator [Clostridiales bacterium]